MWRKGNLTTGLRGVLAPVLALLLALQVSLAFFPTTLDPTGERVQLVLCGPDGLRTVSLNLTDGSIDDSPAPEITGKCPFCIVGIAALSGQPAMDFAQAEFHGLRFAPAAVPAPGPVRLDRARPIRAPPLSA